jgi:hypothetical protein
LLFQRSSYSLRKTGIDYGDALRQTDTFFLRKKAPRFTFVLMQFSIGNGKRGSDLSH